ncbi:MAG TPA: aldo/keto reductase [Acidimicrobiales bacterium]|jgi:aryl-alcohol dehydrogenase-like predicted oxidoreductase|nr:aldo/keto reductase [Acidimicrobiales bacterium]
MESRRLGRTGHYSSLAVLGGAAFWDGDPAVTESAFAEALDAGVNHLDVAPQYGRAQQLLGPLIPAVRDRLFVACKTLRHNGDGVRAQLEESLRLLGCDRFDLYQLHAVNDRAEVDARSDAFEAVLAARDEGLCRFVGITGHDLTAPAAHLLALQRYDLDTVMFPVNPRLWSDPAYRADAEVLLAHTAEHDLGVMAIKSAAARPWGDRPHTAGTWYEPYATAAEVTRGVRFALSTPGVHAVCTPGDTDILGLALAAAGSFTPMDDAERTDAAAAASHEASIFPMPAA